MLTQYETEMILKLPVVRSHGNFRWVETLLGRRYKEPAKWVKINNIFYKLIDKGDKSVSIPPRDSLDEIESCYFAVKREPKKIEPTPVKTKRDPWLKTFLL